MKWEEESILGGLRVGGGRGQAAVIHITICMAGLCSTLPWVFQSQSQGLHSHHIVSQQFCLCWYPEHSTEACGYRMDSLHILPQVGSCGVRIGQFCFAITAASMVTACDSIGKVICRPPEWQRRRQGWRGWSSRWGGQVHASA